MAENDYETPAQFCKRALREYFYSAPTENARVILATPFSKDRISSRGGMLDWLIASKPNALEGMSRPEIWHQTQS